MPKFKLLPAPTFSAAVPIPIPGGAPEKVKFQFKFMDRNKFNAFVQRIQDQAAQPAVDAADAQDAEETRRKMALSDRELLQELCCGWDLDEPFDTENVDLFVLYHLGGPSAVLQTFLAENGKARAGN